MPSHREISMFMVGVCLGSACIQAATSHWHQVVLALAVAALLVATMPKRNAP